MMIRKSLALTALLMALAAPVACAHVTLQPKTAAAGAYAVETVRVPNETEDAVTTKVQVQMPAGFADALYAATPGWGVTVRKEKLATPVQTDDGEITEGVAEITWTADSEADGIQPGQFLDFPLSVQIPGQAGDTLTFKALQTYSDGKVVRWIGAEGSDFPAPTVKVTAQADDHAAAAAPKATTVVKKEEASNTLAIIAIALAAAALLAALVRLR